MLIKYVLAVVLTFGLASAVMAAGSTSKSTPKKAGDYELGVKAVKAANYEKAIMRLSKVVAAKPGNADAWNWIGFSHRKLKKFDQAMSAYRKALAIDPNHRGANEYLGELYLQTGDLAKAKERLKKLDGICTFGCEEFDDLKAAIKAYASK
ncbi:MAG: tetratricopeptide repeat protein, partial [Proteobacteria bacterium]|nr:tetratricopeptide repeat protein [Pseudomonadota bacterium]